MRTTLTIDDDVLCAARGLAARQNRTLGEVISELSRNGLAPNAVSSSGLRNGIPLLTRKSGSLPVTLELVNQLRDDVA